MIEHIIYADGQRDGFHGENPVWDLRNIAQDKIHIRLDFDIGEFYENGLGTGPELLDTLKNTGTSVLWYRPAPSRPL